MCFLLSRYRLRQISMIVVISLAIPSLFQNIWASSLPGSGLGMAIRDLVNDILSKSFDSASDNINNSSQLAITLSNMSDNLSSVQALSSLNGLNSTGNVATGTLSKQITISNGVCNAVVVAGVGSSIMSSEGNCNDQLTGGLGADKFLCGDGTDIIVDFNSTQGDAIVDAQNCEKIM
jgi:hypothetical protein